MKSLEASGTVSEGLVDLSILMAAVEAAESIDDEYEECKEAVEVEGEKGHGSSTGSL